VTVYVPVTSSPELKSPVGLSLKRAKGLRLSIEENDVVSPCDRLSTWNWTLRVAISSLTTARRLSSRKSISIPPPKKRKLNQGVI